MNITLPPVVTATVIEMVIVAALIAVMVTVSVCGARRQRATLPFPPDARRGPAGPAVTPTTSIDIQKRLRRVSCNVYHVAGMGDDAGTTTAATSISPAFVPPAAGGGDTRALPALPPYAQPQETTAFQGGHSAPLPETTAFQGGHSAPPQEY